MNSQVQESEANPASSSQTGSARGKGSEEEEQQGQEEGEQGPGAPEGDEEGGLPKPATGQEEDEGPEATGEFCSCADRQWTIVKGAVLCCAVLGRCATRHCNLCSNQSVITLSVAPQQC